MSKLLTPDAVADLLSVSRGTVYNWAYRRKVPSVKIGRCLRFRQQVIEDLVKTNTFRRRSRHAQAA
jgi:excisionase family DNA binding protein